MSDFVDTRPILGLDTITSLCIESGFGKDRNGNPIEVRLPRAVPLPSKTVVLDRAQDFPGAYLPSLPPLPPSPPSSRGEPLILRVHLDEELPIPIPEEGDKKEDNENGGEEQEEAASEAEETEDEDQYYSALDERRSWVFTLKIIEPESHPFRIPPLVLKLAGERMGKKLSQGAGMYQDLRSVQGLIVPRIFGYFRTRVNLGTTTIIPWDPKCKFPIDANDEFRPPHPFASLNVLLMEQLGNRLPIRIVPEKDLSNELLAMYEELSKLNVQHGDIRYSNILCAPPSPPGLEGEIAPEFGRPFQYRIIDFELAKRINQTPKYMDEVAEQRVDWIVNDVAKM